MDAPARDRYRSPAPLFRRHHLHRPLHGPEGRKSQRLRARRSRNSVVGCARFDHRGGNQRRHIFRHAGRRLQRSAITPICSSPSAPSSARILVSYIFIKPYYDYKVYSIYEYLTARFGVADEKCRFGGFHDHASARVRRAALRRRHRARARLRNDQRRAARTKRKRFGFTSARRLPSSF